MAKFSESFVRISTLAPHDSPITIITEGVETALSLKQAGINGKIIAAVGIHNFKNYQPFEGEKIIIAADNDGQNSITMNTVDKAKKTLENSGAKVLKVMPTQEGDFTTYYKFMGLKLLDRS
nr:toprim domain-containing protein [Orientia tsutsugamushi]